MRKSFLISSILVVMFMVLTGFSSASAKTVDSPETYTVMVGQENPHQGIEILAYFPENVTIHKGDTVHWVQNTNEIHTVTFLDGVPYPELLLPAANVAGADPDVSPLVFNPAAITPEIPPDGVYTGGIGSFANSGLMGREQGQVKEFDLTFNSEGTYNYLCLVHGAPMSGTVTVVDDNTPIPSPNQAMAEGNKQMARALSIVPSVVREAMEQIEPAVMNPDGSLTHYVKVGYSNGGQIDLVQFFPDKLTVRPGDTIIWELSDNDVAPHTVTFLNGAPEPPLAIPADGYLYINPAVVIPTPLPPTDLTRSGVFNSGLLVPGQNTTYELHVGNMKPGLQAYLCQLHDTSGMEGKLMVVPLQK